MIDEQSSASGHDYASNRSAIGAGPCPVCIEMTHQHTATAKKDVQVTDRRHPYSGSTTKSSGGQLGSVISKRWPMYTDGIGITADGLVPRREGNEHCTGAI